MCGKRSIWTLCWTCSEARAQEKLFSREDFSPGGNRDTIKLYFAKYTGSGGKGCRVTGISEGAKVYGCKKSISFTGGISLC